MCELFGVNSNEYIQINDYLEAFYKHCEQHPHGWGLAIMRGNQSIIDKQPLKALDSEYLRNLLDSPIIVKTAFAHIRLATLGYMDSHNCHPFLQIDDNGRTWTLIHNGTIFKSEKLDKYKPVQDGDTDSERILLYIVDEVNRIEKERGHPLDEREMFVLLESLVAQLAKNNKLNLMLFNGSTMYIHTNCKKGLHYLRIPTGIIVSTKALSDENWEEIPINTLFALKDGEIFCIGKQHYNEYKVTKEDFKFIVDNLSPAMREMLAKNFGELNAEQFLESQNQTG